MLKCEDCGMTFDEDKLATWQEDRGEFWGSRAFETCSGCPYCYSGAVIEAKDDDDDDDDAEGEEE